MKLPKPVVVLGLVGLLLLDMVLIVWALWPASPSSTTALSPLATGAAEPTPAGGGLNSSVTPDLGALPRGSRLVSATSSADAWLAEAGACGQPGRLFVTSTGGDEWSEQSLPGSVTRLRPSDGSSAFIVGGDEDCQARVWYTGDGGASWSPPQSAEEAWGRDPDDARIVLRSGGAPAQPCEDQEVLDVVGLAGASTVLCADGRIRASSDRGESWATNDRRSGLLALSLAELGRGAAAGVEDGCRGVAVHPLVDGRLGESSCVETSTPSGPVAISVAPGAVWLIVGDEVLRADSLDAPFSVVSPWPGA